MNMSNKQQKSRVVASFDIKATSSITGISIAMLNYLCRYELVVPSANEKRGRGTRRAYTFADVLLLRIVSKLLEQGISVLRLRKSLEAFQERNGSAKELLSRKYVLTDGYNLYFKDNEILEMLSSGQMAFAFVIELSKVRSEINDYFERLRKVS